MVCDRGDENEGGEFTILSAMFVPLFQTCPSLRIASTRTSISVTKDEAPEERGKTKKIVGSESASSKRESWIELDELTFCLADKS